MFPSIEPFASGWLPVGEGNSLYWETSGNPDGVPAIRLHGGPGSGLSSGYRRDFDPDLFLIVGLDQRGCGRSRPLATDDLTEIASNTTANQLSDLEALREHLDIDRWMITGISWGTTLALAYAQAFPERVLSLVLAAVVTTSDEEVDWVTEQMGCVFPREWELFAAESGARNGQRVIDAYYARITDPNPGFGRPQRAPGARGKTFMYRSIRCIARASGMTTRISACSSPPSSSTTGSTAVSPTGSLRGCRGSRTSPES